MALLKGKKVRIFENSNILNVANNPFFKPHWLSFLQVVGINSKEQKVKLDDGAEIRYDKLLLAPGLLLGTEISYTLSGRILKF